MYARPRGEAHLSPLWAAVGIASLVALLAFGAVAGRALVQSGLLALLGVLAFEEGEVFRQAPLDTALIALTLLPWPELAGCALALGLLGLALRRIAVPPRASPAVTAAEEAPV